MTRTDFTLALEQELQFRGRPFDRGELPTFVADVWPLAEDDPDPVRWAGEFLEAGLGGAEP
jgi:hypothetical protein